MKLDTLDAVCPKCSERLPILTEYERSGRTDDRWTVVLGCLRHGTEHMAIGPTREAALGESQRKWREEVGR